MENEQNNDNSRNINVFKLDYKKQKMNNNLKFIKWKKQMLRIYGINSKIFFCSKDNIYFYASNDEFNKFPFYQGICPFCNKKVCYFCSRPSNVSRGLCCIKRSLKFAFIQNPLRFLRNEFNYEVLPLNKNIVFYPGFHIMIITLFIDCLFYSLLMKNEKYFYKKKKYSSHYNKTIISTILIAFYFTMFIPFFILDIYSIIITLLFTFFVNDSLLKYTYSFIIYFKND